MQSVDNQQIACKDCNDLFTFTAREQQQFAAKGFPTKVRCTECSKAKKRRFADAEQAAGGAKKAQPRCFNCGQKGHTAKECSKPQGSTACFVCGEEGHESRDCPKKPAAGPPRCFRCGGSGHLGTKCPKASSVAEGACYVCGQAGHTARQCPNGQRAVDDAKVEALVARRTELREANDYAAADAVRAELKALGVTVVADGTWRLGGRSRGSAKTATPGLCYAFAQGECARGEECRFRHVAE